MAFLLVGCESVTKLEVMMGVKNLEFEFMQSVDDVDKIIIQNVRDTRFEFTTTDKNAIIDIYDILSKGKIAEEKSNLSPDYTLTVYTSDDGIYNFNYITGNLGSSIGNFYDDNGNIFYISDSLDKNIINNFLLFRKLPRNFNEVYYNCIIDAMNQYNKSEDSLINKKITIDLNGDAEYRKFIFSNDVNNFIDKLSKSNFDGDVYDFDKAKSADVDLLIKTIGFDEYTYKCVYTFVNNLNGTKESYSLKAKYETEKWHVEIAKDENSE